MIAAVTEAQALTGIGVTAVTSLLIAAFQLASGAKKSVTETLARDNDNLRSKIEKLENALKDEHASEEALKRRVNDQQDEINSLKAQVATLIQGEQFWKSRYHELRAEMK